MNYLYAGILLLIVFSFTSILDNNNYAFIAEFIKSILFFVLLYIQDFSWYGLEGLMVYILITYFICSLLLTYYLQNNEKNNRSISPNPV